MDPAHALTLYERFAGDRLTFLYSGAFLDAHSARLIDLQEQHLEREGASRGIRGKLAFVLVEAYQNIVRHRVKDDPVAAGQGRSLFLLRCGVDAHEVTAINAVPRSEVGALEVALERLSGLDMGEMKRIFLRGLQNEVRTERGGAGLGLVEMARRSGNPLRHTFTAVDGAHELFGLQVLVGDTGGWLSEGALPVDLHHTVAENGIMLMHRGALHAVAQENLLRMIEQDLSDGVAGASRTAQAFLLMMGMVADLGTGGEGPMVAVSNRTGHSTVTLAAPIDPRSEAHVHHTLAQVLSLDGPALQRRYRDILLGRSGGGSGLELGLIDLSRRSVGPLRSTTLTWHGSPFVVLEADV